MTTDEAVEAVADYIEDHDDLDTVTPSNIVDVYEAVGVPVKQWFNLALAYRLTRRGLMEPSR